MAIQILMMMICRSETMDYKTLTLGQLLELARYTKRHRYAALLELDRRIPRDEPKKVV